MSQIYLPGSNEIHFLPYQEQWILDTSPLRIIQKPARLVSPRRCVPLSASCKQTGNPMGWSNCASRHDPQSRHRPTGGVENIEHAHWHVPPDCTGSHRIAPQTSYEGRLKYFLPYQRKWIMDLSAAGAFWGFGGERRDGLSRKGWPRLAPLCDLRVLL
jgi:hypothetical protein